MATRELFVKHLYALVSWLIQPQFVMVLAHAQKRTLVFVTMVGMEQVALHQCAMESWQIIL